MKSSLMLRTLVLASTLAGTASHAADPQPAPAVPDIPALLAMLNRLVAEAGIEPEPAAEAVPAPAIKAPPAPAPAPRQPPAATLRMSSLTPSAALGGRGAGSPARGTEADWRVLFPLKPARN